MSITVNFKSAPRTRRHATLFHNAREAMRLVTSTRETLLKLDNESPDDNRLDGQSVVSNADISEAPLHYSPVGELRIHSIARIEGSLSENAMKATLEGESGSVFTPDLTVAFEENESTKRYQVVKNSYTNPVSIVIVEEKGTGALSVTRTGDDFPYVFDQISKGVDKEHQFAATGPTDTDHVDLYQRGRDLIRQVESDTARLKGMDNTASDLNPEAGIVIAADFKRMESDNWAASHMVSPYTVPVEAELHFDPDTGETEDLSLGFGEGEVLSYHRAQDGGERFLRKRFLEFHEVVRANDGSMTVKKHQSTRLKFHLKEKRYQDAVAAWNALPWYGKLFRKIFGG